jgi:nucleoside-diphosphate-sugar epimerase
LAQHLVANQHDVTALSPQDCAAASETVTIDVTAQDSPPVLEKLAAPEVVVHTYSKEPGPGELLDFVNANVHATSNLVEGLTQQPPRLIIYTSTLSVYGRPSVIPIDEAGPAGGSLPYGATKRWAEQLLETFQRYTRIIVLRLPSLYQNESFIDSIAALRNATSRSSCSHGASWSVMHFTSETYCAQLTTVSRNHPQTASRY